MPKLELISVEDDFCRGMLEELKQYASVPDDSRDALLNTLLRNAALRVQESADKAILKTKLRLTVQIPTSGIIRLYMGGGDVEECVDEKGESLRFDPLPGGRLQLYRRGGEATVTYKTQPVQAVLDSLRHTVIRYATADYDGATTQELNQILSEAR